MWIIPKNPTSASTLAGPASTLESNSLCQELAQSCTWRGKLSPSRTWSTRLKKVRWLGLLSGRATTIALSKDWWARYVEWLPVPLVNRTVLLGSGSGRQTSGTDGPSSATGLLTAFDRAGYFSKTSQGLLGTSCGSSFLTWKAEATELRGDLRRRLRLAPRIAGSGCSCSGSTLSGDIWPTPDHQASETRTNVGGSQGRTGPERPVLGLYARQWTTPQAHDVTKRGAGNRENPNGGNACLASDATQWPTPRGEDSECCGNHPGATDSLTGATKLWQTPQTPKGDGTGRSGDRIGEPLLDGQARQWPTASARDWKDGQASEATMDRNARPLNEIAVHWPTPNTPRPHDSENTAGADFENQNQNDLARAASRFGPPPPTTSTPGGKCSHKTRRLNPRFVEWLMGWPQGWTAFDCSETELCQWKRRWRSWLFGENSQQT